MMSQHDNSVSTEKKSVHIDDFGLCSDLTGEDAEVEVLDVLPVGLNVDRRLALVLEALVTVEHAPARRLAAPAARIEAALLAAARLLSASAAALLAILSAALLAAKATAALTEAAARVEVLGLGGGPVVDHGERRIVFHMEVVKHSVHLLLLRVALCGAELARAPHTRWRRTATALVLLLASPIGRATKAVALAEGRVRRVLELLGNARCRRTPAIIIVVDERHRKGSHSGGHA